MPLDEPLDGSADDVLAAIRRDAAIAGVLSPVKCVICGVGIPAARIAVQPKAVTCSRDCSAENSRNLRRRSALRLAARRRATGRTGGPGLNAWMDRTADRVRWAPSRRLACRGTDESAPAYAICGGSA